MALRRRRKMSSKFTGKSFDEIYDMYLDTYSSEIADHLTNYFYHEFKLAEKERKDDELAQYRMESERQDI